MEERIVVSGDDCVRAYTSALEETLAVCRLRGAGAICAGKDCLFAAGSPENTIWRLDGKTLLPTGVFSGGPGMAQLMLSRDGKRLYALCSDADSILMLDAQSGAPQVLARAGVNPCAMAQDEQGETIAVAGGASGDVILLSSETLRLFRRLETRGMVFAVAAAKGRVYALSLTETMDSVLTCFLSSGVRYERMLPGLPGALSVHPDGVAAATHGRMYILSKDGTAVIRHMHVPGRAGRMLETGAGLTITDVWSDTLFLMGEGKKSWKAAVAGVRDVATLKLFD